MKLTDVTSVSKSKKLKENGGRIVKGVNTTADVSTDEIKKQAAKFGNKVDKDGRPPTLSKKVKGSKTNVLFNLGMAENKKLDEKWTPMERALMEGGHSIEDYYQTEAQEIASSTEIYVDMDGVLVDFFGAWAKLMQKDHFTKIDDVKGALQKIRDTDDFWLNLPKTSNADQLLNIIKQVKGNYTILSSPLADDPNSEPHKREWIKNNLTNFPPKDVIITHDKAKYATQKDGTPNILIDDYGVNIKNWQAAGGVGFKHKDHKFERTAKAIKQHMQEPVEGVTEGALSVPTGAFRDHVIGLVQDLDPKTDTAKLAKIARILGKEVYFKKDRIVLQSPDFDFYKDKNESTNEGVVQATKEDLLAYKKIIGLAKKAYETNEIDPYFYDAVKITFNMNLYKKYPKLLSTLLKLGRRLSKEDWPMIVQDIKKNTGIDLTSHINEISAKDIGAGALAGLMALTPVSKAFGQDANTNPLPNKQTSTMVQKDVGGKQDLSKISVDQVKSQIEIKLADGKTVPVSMDDIQDAGGLDNFIKDSKSKIAKIYAGNGQDVPDWSMYFKGKKVTDVKYDKKDFAYKQGTIQKAHKQNLENKAKWEKAGKPLDKKILNAYIKAATKMKGKYALLKSSLRGWGQTLNAGDKSPYRGEIPDYKNYEYVNQALDAIGHPR